MSAWLWSSLIIGSVLVEPETRLDPRRLEPIPGERLERRPPRTELPVDLQSDGVARVGEPIVLRMAAATDDPVRFTIDWGDGAVEDRRGQPGQQWHPGWSQAEALHVYGEPGEHHVHVVARLRTGEIGEAEHVVFIERTEPIGPPPGPDPFESHGGDEGPMVAPSPPERPPPGRPPPERPPPEVGAPPGPTPPFPWWWLALGAVVVVVTGLVVRRLRPAQTPEPRTRPRAPASPEVTFRPRPDRRARVTFVGGSPALGPAVSLRPVRAPLRIEVEER